MKDEIRKEMILVRKQIMNKDQKSHHIVEKIIKHPKYLEANDIALYKNLKDEVSLEELIIDAWKRGKKVYVPRVVNDDLVFYAITKNSSFEKSDFHVLEPLEDSLQMKHADLILVPGVAFDQSLHRMGFGKGYYDRFLKDKDMYKIGICFQEQLRESIPISENDIMMDEIVTDA